MSPIERLTADPNVFSCESPNTYVGRPETDWARISAMTILGNGLSDANQHEDALSVQEAELAMERRLGASESHMLVVQSNLASSYSMLGRVEEALILRREVYSGKSRLCGQESTHTLMEANRYAATLVNLQRYKEAKSLLRKTVPVARRVLGEGHQFTLLMRQNYATALLADPTATLDDLREAVMTLEDSSRTARRVLGGTHPDVAEVEKVLEDARADLRARETSGIA